MAIAMLIYLRLRDQCVRPRGGDSWQDHHRGAFAPDAALKTVVRRDLVAGLIPSTFGGRIMEWGRKADAMSFIQQLSLLGRRSAKRPRRVPRRGFAKVSNVEQT
jgi:hypothetical protein